MADKTQNPSTGDGIHDGSADVDNLIAESQDVEASSQRRFAWRKVLAALLVILTSLGVVTSTIAIWAHETVFDTDQFMETLDPALGDPALYAVIGERASSSVLDVLDLETRVTAALTRLDEYLSQALIEAIDPDEQTLALLARFDRPSLTALAPSIVESLETRVEEAVESFFASEPFVTRFPDLVRRSHELTIALIRDELEELPNVYVADGEVRLDLIPFIAGALRNVEEDIRGFLPEIDLPAVVSDRLDESRKQLAAAIQAELPPDFGQVTVISQDALGQVQGAAEQLDRLVWVVVLATILLAAVTIVVSPTRRRTAVYLSIGVVVGIVIAAALIRRLEGAILAEIASPDGDEVARVLLEQVLSSLRAIQMLVVLAAAAVGIVAYLVGRPAWVSMTADTMRSPALHDWIAGHDDTLRLAGVGAAVVALYFAGLDLLPVIVIGLLLAVYLWLIAEGKRRVNVRKSSGVVAAVDRDGAKS